MFNEVVEFITNAMMCKLIKKIVPLVNFLMIGEIRNSHKLFCILHMNSEESQPNQLIPLGVFARQNRPFEPTADRILNPELTLLPE